MTETRELVLLVDGHNIIFRAFSSVPRSITSPAGEPVNGIYGLIGTLLRLIRDRRPVYVAVAFDVPETKTFRHQLFPDYQGQRGPLGGVDAANFAWQVDEANKLLGRIGIRAVTAPGFEADDIVGTLSAAADREGRSALIVSSDRDLQQLVTENVHVLIPGKKPLEIGPEDVHARLGIPPARIVDWKVLAGDPSDNIPGVPGIGDKSAVDLVTRFGDWRSVYEHVDELTTRQRAALAAGRAMAELFDDVVTVKCDLDLGVSWDDLRINQDELPERAGDALRLAGLRPEEE